MKIIDLIGLDSLVIDLAACRSGGGGTPGSSSVANNANSSMQSSSSTGNGLTIHIPMVWSKFSDADNFVIQEAWFKRVREVVDYTLNANL